MLESIGIMVAIVTGVIALALSLMQARIQKIKDAEQKVKDAQQKLKDKEMEKKERLYFLANIIVNRDVARKSRQIFYDEYIALGGNGSFVKFWLEEENART
jgi:hypothetical protein